MKRRWKWSLLALVLVIAAVFGAMSLTAGASDPDDRTPEPMATITGYDFVSIVIPGSATASEYYLPAGSTSAADAVTPAPASGPYWELKRIEGETDKWEPTKLILRAGLTALSGPPFDQENGNIDGKPTDLPSGESEALSAAMTETSGTVAVRYGDYYVKTKVGWKPAVAAVHTGVNGTDNTYYSTIASAAEAANALAEAGTYVEIVLLAKIDVTESLSIGTINDVNKLVVFRCADTGITVKDGAVLTLNAKVADEKGQTDAAFCAVTVEGGCTVADYAANAVTAKGGAAVRNGFTARATTLFAENDKETPVSISGTFARVSGYVYIYDDTTIQNTDALGRTNADAYVTGVRELESSNPRDITLTVEGGTVHTLCSFGGNGVKTNLHITGGTMYVEIGETEMTYILGNTPGAGIVNITSGNATVSGTVAELNLTSTTDAEKGSKAYLTGTAGTSVLTGASTLTMQGSGMVTGHVQGVESSGNKPIFVGSSDLTKKVTVYGAFDSIAGAVKIKTDEDLSIDNASATSHIEADSAASDLTLGGAGVSYDPANLTISGQYGTLDTAIDLYIRSGVSLDRGLRIHRATVRVSGGATIGVIGAAGAASSLIEEGKLIVTDSATTVYSTIQGVGAAEYHFALDCKGYPRLYGNFAQATGRAYTGAGDLQINGTQGMNDNQLLLNGGCPHYSDDGLSWNVKLTDAAGSCDVILTSKDGETPGFKSITVDDTMSAGKITLTNAGYEPVQIGSDAAKAATALSITGDVETLVTLTTLGIYGEQKGISVTGADGSLPKVTLTGADSAMQPVTGSGVGVEAVYADLTMENYAITSATGVSATSSEFTLTGSTVTATSTGMTLKDTTAATLNAVDVTSDGSGVVIENQTHVTLENTVNVTAAQTAVSVAGSSTLKNNSGSGTFKSTGSSDDAIALRAADSSTVTLKQYTFLAQNANGQGVIVTGSSTADLSYPTGTTGDNTIWGGENGLFVGEGSTATIKNYHIIGSTSDNAATAKTGRFGARVDGTLRLDGQNTILGAQCGLYVSGGTVTNYRSGEGWTDEKTGAPAGSGTITGGKANGADGVRIYGGKLTLGGYTVTTNDHSGLVAGQSAEVYLRCASITGYKADGVSVDGGACVTIDDAIVKTDGSGTGADYAARVKNGTLNLGPAVTVQTGTAGNAVAAVLGESETAAKLHLHKDNPGVAAEGSFAAASGKLTQRASLTVRSTENDAPYNDAYLSGLTVTGVHAGTAEDSLHLILGPGVVNADLTAGSHFASVSVTGEGERADLDILGEITIDSAYDATKKDYGLKVSNAVVDFVTAAAVRIHAESGTAVTADSSQIFLRGALDIEGKLGGIAVTNNTTLTGLADANGAIVTDSAAATQSLTTGTVKSTAGDALSVGTGSIALLGELNYSALSGSGLSADGAKEVYLAAANYDKAATDPTVNRRIDAKTIASLTNTGAVTIKNYNMAQSSGTGAAITASGTDLAIDSGNLLATPGQTGIDITGKTLTLTDTTVAVSGAAEAAVKANGTDITATDTVITTENDTENGIRSEGGSIELTRVTIGSATAKPKAGIMADGGAGKTLKLTNTEVFASTNGVFFLEGDVTMTDGAIRAENGDGLYAKKGNVRVTDDAFIYAAGSSARIVLVESGDLVMQNTTLATDAANAALVGADVQSGDATLETVTVGSEAAKPQTGVRANGEKLEIKNTEVFASNIGVETTGSDVTLDTVNIGSAAAKPTAGVHATGGAGKTLTMTNTIVYATANGVEFDQGDVTMTGGSITAGDGFALKAASGAITVTGTEAAPVPLHAEGTANGIVEANGNLTITDANLTTGTTGAKYGVLSNTGDVTLTRVTIGDATNKPDFGVRAKHSQPGSTDRAAEVTVHAATTGISVGSCDVELTNCAANAETCVNVAGGSLTMDGCTLTATGATGTALEYEGESGQLALIKNSTLTGQFGIEGNNVTIESGTVTGTERAVTIGEGTLLVKKDATVTGTIRSEDANVYIEKEPKSDAVYPVEGDFKNLFVKMTPAVPADPNVAGSTETPAVIPTIKLTGDTTIDAMRAREADAEGNYPECELKAVADEHCGALTVKSGKLDLDASGTNVNVALTVPTVTDAEGKESPAANVSAKGSLKSLTGTITPTGDLVIRGGTGTLLAVPKDEAIALEISGMSGTADISSYIREYKTLSILAGDATLTQLVTAASEGDVTLQTKDRLTGKKASLVMGEGASMRVLRGGSFKLVGEDGTAIIETQSGRIIGTTELTDYHNITKLCDTGAANHQGWHEKDNAGTTIKIGNGQSYTITKDVTLVEKPLPFSGSVPATTAKITVTAGEGGTVSPGTGAYELGKDAAFNIRPNAGYRIADLIVDGQSVGAGARYTFRALSEGHTLEAVFEKTTPVEELFEDIDEDTWCREAAQLVYDSCIMNGRTETRFMPAAPLNRGMFVTMLYRLEGTPAVTSTSKFSDVTEDTWCHDAVVWGSENAIVSGYSDGTFRPTATVSRQQLVTFLWRYSKAIGLDVSVGENTNILSYEDAFDVSEYAVPAVQWACGEQILRGSGGMLYPHADTTRGHAAAFLARFMELLSAAE